MEIPSISKDYFLQEYKKGNVAKANLVDTDFSDLVELYNSGTITFNEYSRLFYKRAIELIVKRLRIYPI